jgi:hypothetical protein
MEHTAKQLYGRNVRAAMVLQGQDAVFEWDNVLYCWVGHLSLNPSIVELNT